jgi:hypothetical protein
MNLTVTAALSVGNRSQRVPGKTLSLAKKLEWRAIHHKTVPMRMRLSTGAFCIGQKALVILQNASDKIHYAVCCCSFLESATRPASLVSSQGTFHLFPNGQRVQLQLLVEASLRQAFP